MSHGCRKNIVTMGDTERRAFRDAVLKMKADGVYDPYVEMHREMFLGIAHRGLGFLAWHRELLRRFEADLRAADSALRGGTSTLSIPYWDWTSERSTVGLPWTTDFLGGDGDSMTNIVQTGEFAYSNGRWTITIGDGGTIDPELRRDMGDKAFPTGRLPDTGHVTNTMGQTTYIDFRWSLEQLHNWVHNWVGGNMMEMTSPNEPVFWLHHCMLDKIWADWQAANPTVAYPTGGNDVGGFPLRQGEKLTDPMGPWNQNTPADVLVHATLGYRYDTEWQCNVVLPKKILDQSKKLAILDLTKSLVSDPVKFPLADVATNPRIDWVKTPALDKPPGGDRMLPSRPTPFLLATDHHAPRVKETGDELAELDAIWRQQLSTLGSKFALGELDDAQEKEFQTLRKEYRKFRELADG